MSGNFLLIHICNFHVLGNLVLIYICKFHCSAAGSASPNKTVEGSFLLIYICNFHVLSNLLLIYICKLHWMFVCQVHFLLIYKSNFHVSNHSVKGAIGGFSSCMMMSVLGAFLMQVRWSLLLMKFIYFLYSYVTILFIKPNAFSTFLPFIFLVATLVCDWFDVWTDVRNYCSSRGSYRIDDEKVNYF